MPDFMSMIADLLVNRPQANATRGVHFPGGAMQSDIPLPMPPGGQVDPSIPPDILETMGKAAAGYRGLRDTLGGIGRAQDTLTRDPSKQRAQPRRARR